jgi:uncharacterized protein YjeT (DUF2065 family)
MFKLIQAIQTAAVILNVFGIALIMVGFSFIVENPARFGALLFAGLVALLVGVFTYYVTNHALTATTK